MMTPPDPTAVLRLSGGFVDPVGQDHRPALPRVSARQVGWRRHVGALNRPVFKSLDLALCVCLVAMMVVTVHALALRWC